MRNSVRVKICGITNAEDGLAAAQAGADYLGYIFFSRSPRNVAPSAAADVIRQVRARHPAVQHVGVFVNEPLDHLQEIAATADLDLVQLHGAETPEYCAAATDSGIRCIKVFKFGNGAEIVDWTRFGSAQWFLCDTYSAASEGGTGAAFDRALLPDGFPLERSFLAGGLRPDNIASVLSDAAPFAVDVSSGVEASPGRKDHEKVREFIRQVRLHA